MRGTPIPTVRTHEKRLAPRLPIPSGDFVIHTGSSWKIRNLSQSGAFLEDPHPLLPGSPLFMELHLGNERIPCSGVVRRSLPQVGMGIQFLQVDREMQDRLERYLNNLAKSAPTTESVACPAAPSSPPSVARPEPQKNKAQQTETTCDQGSLSAHLQKLSTELRVIEEFIKAGEVDPRVLHEFRDAVDQIRVTAWVVQQWAELQARQEDAYAVLPFITKERMRRMAKLSDDLALDIDATEIETGNEGLEALRLSIERLHLRLARFFKSPAP